MRSVAMRRVVMRCDAMRRVHVSKGAVQEGDEATRIPTWEVAPE